MKKSTTFILLIFLSGLCAANAAIAREAYPAVEEAAEESIKLKGEIGESGKIINLGSPAVSERAEADREEHWERIEENTGPEFGTPDPASTEAEIDF